MNNVLPHVATKLHCRALLGRTGEDARPHVNRPAAPPSFAQLDGRGRPSPHGPCLFSLQASSANLVVTNGDSFTFCFFAARRARLIHRKADSTKNQRHQKHQNSGDHGIQPVIEDQSRHFMAGW